MRHESSWGAPWNDTFRRRKRQSLLSSLEQHWREFLHSMKLGATAFAAVWCAAASLRGAQPLPRSSLVRLTSSTAGAAPRSRLADARTLADEAVRIARETGPRAAVARGLAGSLSLSLSLFRLTRTLRRIQGAFVRHKKGSVSKSFRTVKSRQAHRAGPASFHRVAPACVL